MKICLFHPKLLPPKDYGGVERVVLWLAQGLLERGHEVWVAALAGSRLPAGVRLVEMHSEAVSAWDLLPKLPSGIDVVHFMAPPEAGTLEKLPAAGILTVHGNGKPGEVFPQNTVFLSADHARRHGAGYFVFNGIDPAELRYRSREEKKKSLLFLSKTSWRVKNVSGAVKLCRRAGASLAISGGNRPWGARIQAALIPGMRWEGAVGGEKKAQLLAEARAFLFPVIWSEPFGLVVAEALMSGTPVLASRLGSLPELVTPEVGRILESPVTPEACDAWVDVIEGVKTGRIQWDSERCRAWAMEKFHYLKMAEGYENAYKRVIHGEKLNQQPPRTS